MLILKVAVVVEQLYSDIDSPIPQLEAVSGSGDPPAKQSSAVGELPGIEIVWDHKLPFPQV